MLAIAVAVCVDRLAPALPAALAAVSREVPEPIVAAAGLTVAEVVAVRQLGMRTAPGARVVQAEPGIAQARNAALAAASGADVLVLLDDDVAPSTGWLARVRAAWDAAPGDRAVLGGPIALRFDAPRPRWLADGLLPTLAPLDYGHEALVLDPHERTLRGGNIGFRTTALRAVGAFWPSLAGERDWFSVEHQAQRELAAAGWSVEYRPEIGVDRIVRVDALKPPELAARRLRSGGRAQLVGRPRDVGDALKAAATGLAGAGAALVRGDVETASERAGRAVENAGAVAAPLVAHRGLQPTAPSTPFRSSVPERQPVLKMPTLRRYDGSRGVTLLYHRVADVEHDPLGLTVSPANFAAHIDALHDRIVPLEQLASGDFPDGAVAITFDDGYADNLPALRDIGVPVTVFISTGHVEEGRTFWWDELARLLRTARATTPLTVALGADVRTWPARDDAGRELARRGLHVWLQVRSGVDIETALEQVRAWANAPDAPDPRPLTLAELRELAQHVTIGAHGRNHLSLRWRSPEEQRDEMQRSRDDLAEWLGSRPSAFSYPFGVPDRDVSSRTIAIAREVGFACAVVNSERIALHTADPLAVPRTVAQDTAAVIPSQLAKFPSF